MNTPAGRGFQKIFKKAFNISFTSPLRLPLLVLKIKAGLASYPLTGGTMKKFLVIVFLMILAVPCFVQAQDDYAKLMVRVRNLENQVSNLESKIGSLQSKIRNNSGGAASVFFFAVFCAFWAQNTNRNPWQWFFLGLIFNIFTAFFLLSKNAADKQMKSEPWRIS